MTSFHAFVASAAFVVAVASGCGTMRTAAVTADPPKPELLFIDLPQFDKDLDRSLEAKLGSVDVTFYDRVSPSAMPVRLQSWLAAVKDGGGEVTVVYTEKPRGLPLAVSILGAILDAIEKAKTLGNSRQFTAAGNYDAKVLLKQVDGENTVVEKIVFIQRVR